MIIKYITLTSVLKNGAMPPSVSQWSLIKVASKEKVLTSLILNSAGNTADKRFALILCYQQTFSHTKLKLIRIEHFKEAAEEDDKRRKKMQNCLDHNDPSTLNSLTHALSDFHPGPSGT